MTEICSSNSVEEMPFQPPFQHVHVQMELHRLPASTGTFPSHLPTVSASSSSSLTCSPPHYSSFCHCFFSLPCLTSASMLCSPAGPLLPWPLLCAADRTTGGKTLQAEGNDCGLTAKENGRGHQVLQAASFTLRRTLNWIKTGPPRILFPGETPHACWRYYFVKLYHMLNDANRLQLLGVGTRVLKADTALHLSLRCWESPGIATTEKTSPEQSPQNFGSPCSEV